MKYRSPPLSLDPQSDGEATAYPDPIAVKVFQTSVGGWIEIGAPRSESWSVSVPEALPSGWDHAAASVISTGVPSPFT
jgi:hypothetical protein